MLCLLMKKILRKIRLAINRIGSSSRRKMIKSPNPTIISNNCYAGIVYEYLGLKFNSPTIGIYFYAPEYIKFCKNFDYYIKKKLKFITYKDSKYRDELIRRKEQNVIIGVLDDVEIVFLHYKTKQEAKNKWERRCKRINKKCLIFKFCDQNLCSENDIVEFDKLPYKNKFCFTSKDYPDLKSTIWIKRDKNRQEVKKDYYVGHKYFNIIDFINTCKYRDGQEVLRVLQLGMTSNLGGIETYLMNYYRTVDKSKIQFDFLNIYNNPLCFSNDILGMGGKIFNVPSYYKHPFKYLKETKKIINSNSYFIIHCNMNSAAMIYPLIAAKMSRARVIISHAHNSSSDKGVIKSLLHDVNKHFIPLLANRFYACSDKAGKWFFTKRILDSCNYKIIYNAVDLKKYKYNEKNRREIRKELGIADDCFVLGHVGRFNKQKNHKFIIDIFNDISGYNKNVILLLIGKGPLITKIKELVKKNNMTNSVIFLENRNDMEKIYCAMDLFILPSLYEGLPLVGVEAQLCGLKCLFSDTITNELSISKHSEYLPLVSSVWVNRIVGLTQERSRFVVAGDKFNIEINTKMLENNYMEEIEKYGKK